MPPSQRQRSQRRQLREIPCQRRRPRSTKTSIRSSRRWTRGTKMDHRKKVSGFVWIRWNLLTSSFAGNFYSSSDSESDDEIERKIHVEIKPLNNGTAPISASVDELRATVENLSLSPIGALSVSFFHLISFHFHRFFCLKFLKKNLTKFKFRWGAKAGVVFHPQTPHRNLKFNCYVCFLIYCISMPSFFSFSFMFFINFRAIKIKKKFKWKIHKILFSCVVLCVVTNSLWSQNQKNKCSITWRIWTRSRSDEVRRTRTNTWNDRSRCHSKWPTRPVT